MGCFGKKEHDVVDLLAKLCRTDKASIHVVTASVLDISSFECLDTWLYVDWHFQPAWWNVVVVDVPIFFSAATNNGKSCQAKTKPKQFLILLFSYTVNHFQMVLTLMNIYSERLDMSFCTFPAA